MVRLEKEKCAACGRCGVVCPWGAILCFGYPEIDSAVCTDCRGKQPREDPSDGRKRRACVEYCPVGALNPAI
jgi:Fe-S-cluster-containing hydrogenase component 2